jgi:hypothetical protein
MKSPDFKNQIINKNIESRYLTLYKIIFRLDVKIDRTISHKVSKFTHKLEGQKSKFFSN